jgi:hypothetical protein
LLAEPRFPTTDAAERRSPALLREHALERR